MDGDDNWPTKIVGPLGKLQAGINLILELGQDAADKDTELDKERISNIIFKMVLDLHALTKVINPEHGSGQLMTRWTDGFDSILGVMHSHIGDGACPDFIKEKMEYLVDDMKKFK